MATHIVTPAPETLALGPSASFATHRTAWWSAHRPRRSCKFGRTRCLSKYSTDFNSPASHASINCVRFGGGGRSAAGPLPHSPPQLTTVVPVWPRGKSRFAWFLSAARRMFSRGSSSQQCWCDEARRGRRALCELGRDASSQGLGRLAHGHNTPRRTHLTKDDALLGVCCRQKVQARAPSTFVLT